MKKKMLGSLVALSSLVFAAALGSCSSKETLVFFNWGEYINPDLITEFEQENDVNVKLLTFDTNENMLVKLQSSSDYDVVIPSDYAIEELADKGDLLPLDLTKFSNYSPDKLVPSFHERLTDLAQDNGTEKGFDLLKYAVPYTWGEVGLIYDSSKIGVSEIESEGWEALRTAKNSDGSDRKVCVYDSSRDVYSIALAALGYDFVDPTEAQISAATDWLKGMKSALGDNLSFRTDEILDEMPAHDYDICLDFSGDAAYSIMNEEDPVSPLKFYIPDAVANSLVRTNIYTDAMVIPASSKHVDLAYKFIDFLNSDEAAASNTEYIGYTTPLESVYEAETGEGGMYCGVDGYAVQASSKDHFYRYNEALKTELEDLWNKEIRL